MDFHILEINLISAQDLKPPSGRGSVQSYAVAWIDPSAKLRTRIDRVGGENPTWNDRFLFRVPARFLAEDSPSAVSVEIYASGGWLIPDSLIGTVRFLIGNERLLRRQLDSPSFAAVGIRRPSGRFHGVLNVGATLLGRHVPLLAEALVGSSAVAYRDLMSNLRRRTTPEPSPAPSPLGDVNRDLAASRHGRKEENEMGSDSGVVFCGPCLLPFPRKIHLSPSDQNLQLTTPEQSPRR